MAHPIAVTVLTVLLFVEFVTDQLPKTPSRKSTPQLSARLLTGAATEHARGWWPPTAAVTCRWRWLRT
ncbi:hypothetical protein MSAR_42490 [Mycolicibacterium sarraceniae]|uniref:Uncharacterized protein n=1 Tax=Mycolicibacterium sarraceniae TaxID=1534348 RepID=A0A7I7SWM6_9MYCO|nr:hypothetical protein MSAR_42490 [Mycolicibacterium sarraceniae]